MTTTPRKFKNLDEMFWCSAMGDAKFGFPDKLATRLRDPNAVIPVEVREYLAAVIEGSQRAPVRKTRTDIDPYMLAKIRAFIARQERLLAGGYLSPKEVRDSKKEMMDAIAKKTGAKPSTVRVRWNELAAIEKPKAQRMEQLMRESNPEPKRTVYRNGKPVQLKS